MIKEQTAEIEVFDAAPVTVRKQVDVQKLTKFIGSKLYGFEAAPALAYAYNAGENVLMFGDGGYGKSEAANLFAQYLFENGHTTESRAFVVNCGQGLTEDKLLGGLDLKKFQDEGEIIYLLSKAFVEHRIVVFEEIWDAYPGVLLVLKDIMQSKTVRMGNQFVPIKTEMFIACTNRSRHEVIEDKSTEALFQRFLYEVEVGWTSHTQEDYDGAIRAATGEQDTLISLISMVCAQSSMQDGFKVSPRIAVKAYKNAKTNGVQCLHYVYGLKENLEHAMRLYRIIQDIEKTSSLAERFASKASQVSQAMKILSLAAMIHDQAEALRSMGGIPDELAETREKAYNQVKHLRDVIYDLGQSRISVPPATGSFAATIKSWGSNPNWAQIKRSYEDYANEETQ